MRRPILDRLKGWAIILIWAFPKLMRDLIRKVWIPTVVTIIVYVLIKLIGG